MNLIVTCARHLEDETEDELIDILDELGDSDVKIAVRIPDSKCTLKLLAKCELIVGTSANISGNSSYTNPDDCIKDIKNYDLFLNGGTITSKGESTIIEIENEKIKVIREGALKIGDIEV